MADINVGQISEALNDKTDRDFNNMNPSALSKETVVGWGMPDYSAGVSVGIPTSGSPFIAPSHGVYIFQNRTSGESGLYVNGYLTMNSAHNTGSFNVDTSIVPLYKGDSVYFKNATSVPYSTFYPMKGVG